VVDIVLDALKKERPATCRSAVIPSRDAVVSRAALLSPRAALLSS
jgi:hypothetical protein